MVLPLFLGEKMIYGRASKDGNIVVHQVFSLATDMPPSVQENVFKNPKFVEAAEKIGTSLKSVRALSQSCFGSAGDFLGNSDKDYVWDKTQESLFSVLRTFKDGDRIPIVNESIRAMCHDIINLEAQVEKGTLLFSDHLAFIKAKKLKDGRYVANAISHGHTAVLLKNFMEYIKASTIQSARVLVLTTLPLKPETENQKWWLVVTQANPASQLSTLSEKLLKKPA